MSTLLAKTIICHPERMRKGLVLQSLSEEKANAEILSLHFVTFRMT